MKLPGNIRLFRASMKAQLAAVLIAVSIIPTFTVGVVAYTNSIREIIVEKTNTLKAYTEGITGKIDTQIESAGHVLQGLSSQSDIMVVLEDYNAGLTTNNVPRYNSLLHSLKNVVGGSKELYETVFITDINGKVIMDGSKYRFDYKDKPFYSMEDFKHIKGKGELFVGNPTVSKATGKLLLPVSRPVKSLAGFLGIMTIMFDLEKFTSSFDEVKPGATGEVLILNDKNIVVYHTNKEHVNSVNSNSALYDILKANDTRNEFIRYKEQRILKASYYIKSKKTSWLVCAQVDNSEFIGPVIRFRNFLLVLAVALVLIVVTISMVYSGYIVRPITKLVELMKQVEKGDLNVSVRFNTVIDEIGELKKGFSDMLKNLRTLINEVINASTQISSCTANMTAASQNSLAHGEQTTGIVMEITNGIQRQSDNTDTTVKNIEALAERINTTKSVSDKISLLSEKVNKSVEKGFNLVEVLEYKSRENLRSTNLVETVIDVLNKEMTEINKIARTITNIAKQTKLLSLNASIEAARAGDAGKGFAVVAGEIKNLSDQTSTEAGEINKLINNIQNNAAELVTTMEGVSLAAEEQERAVVSTQKAFGQISAAIQDIDKEIKNIALHLDEMNEEKNNIVYLIRDIKGISMEVAISSDNIQMFTDNQIKMIKDVHNHADALNELASGLNRSIDNFKI